MKKGFCFLLLVLLLAVLSAPRCDEEKTFAEMWQQVKKLQNEQKYQAALDLVLKIHRRAVDENVPKQWAEALVQTVLLKRGLHSYETAVRFLMEEKWPQAPREQALLHLFYANSLYDYYQNYAWEINRREKVVAKKGVDLKKWTAFDIFTECNQQYDKAYRHHQLLVTLKIKDFPSYIRRGTYPEHIRATMYDFVVYQWASFLGNTNTWRPVELKEKYKLDFLSLTAEPESRKPQQAGFFLDSKQHPLARMVYLLDELYRQHIQNKQHESALESQLERIRKLSAIFDSDKQRDILLAPLDKLLAGYTNYPWWAMGQFEYASLLKKKGELVSAHRIATAGQQKYPDSIGGKKCQYLARALEIPDFRIQAMTIDCPGARSIEVAHKNIDKLYFRAYRIEFFNWINRKYRYFGNIHADDLRWLLDTLKPEASWQVSLPNLGDYQYHKTYVKPQVKNKGFYIIAASVREDFSLANNRRLATYMMLSDLITVANYKSGGWEVLVANGNNGKPVAGATVTLYKYNYNKGPERQAELTTLSDGRVTFPYHYQRGSCFIVARHGEQISFDPRSFYFSRERPARPKQGCFIYTDRSIYRPLQKLYFKIVTYQGSQAKASYHCLPGRRVKVNFRDPNGKVVETIMTKTNDYGTASGEFTIPKGRILGQYSLRCVIGKIYGHHYFRVEEYKRPTFEVELRKPEKALLLNTPVEISGNARYYFGLPLTTGKVFYRVTRVPVWPWWYWWFYSGGQNSRHTYEIAAGNVTVSKDGTFRISFVPQADPEMAAQKSISYNFKIEVEVTDEGGETRNATQAYPIGFVAVRADYQMPHQYFLAQEDVNVTITRSDLSNVPQPGPGQYRLVRLQQPSQTMTPESFPIKLAPGQKHTPGDALRPRWEGEKSLDQYLFCFSDGATLKSGDLRHGQDGQAALNLGRLQTGAYRLHYSSKDIYGNAYQTHRDFLVASGDLALAVPFFLVAHANHYQVGEQAQVFFGSGFANQRYWLERYRAGKLLERRYLDCIRQLSLPVTEEDRGGFTLRLIGINDYRVYDKTINIYVPWDNKHLQVKFKRFRDLLRPGQKESWTVSIKGAQSEKVAAELLAYMYDRSLDMFVSHSYPQLDSLLPNRQGAPHLRTNLSSRYFSHISSSNWYQHPVRPSFYGNLLIIFSGYPIGGLGRRSHRLYAMNGEVEEDRYGESRPMIDKSRMKNGPGGAPKKEQAAFAPEGKLEAKPKAPIQQQEPPALRENFNETAFFQPHLRTDKNGEVQIEFQIPDSVTSWNVYLHALTKDIRFMTMKKTVVTRKDMMVRPYMPRFFREGDQAVLKVAINNATDKPLDGEVTLQILDADTKQDKGADFALAVKEQNWKVAGKGSTTVSWKLTAPRHLGSYAFRVEAQSQDYTDGELRPVPVLPSRIHLVQSRFVTLKDNDRRQMYLADLAKADLDPTLVHESLIVSLDGQLIYTVLKALPYLAEYPYECVEQTLNRFLSTSIVTSLYDQYPAIARMAKEFSKRDTHLDPWQKKDPNRKMALEETPWLVTAEGGRKDNLINVLDPQIAKTQKEMAIEKLQKAQLGNGSFPWWPGGPPSPYMTLYLLHGFAKAQEFNVAIPKSMVQNAWRYMAGHFRDYYAKKMIKEDFGYHFITFLNYVLSCYRDASYYQGSFTAKERQEMLDYCFNHWKLLPPYLKAYLALTLVRMDRPKDARLVMESIMDSAITKLDQGTFWAPEDRGWLWYNDNIESHAFVLRALQEVMPDAKQHIDGLVLWLLLNKKMNQWKSTRTTAEVIYSLVYTMHRQKSLGVREKATVTIGPQVTNYVFEPDSYSGGHKQIVISGQKIEPKTMAQVQVEKSGRGYMFASLAWHYSTEQMPTEARGDFLAVTRRYFLRKHEGQEYVLRPIEEGTEIQVGDQIEIHLSIRSKHPMEYVHLRDPRGAGFEPEKQVSGHRWDLGICWYEEVRDSGTNFFFEWLPQGEYNFKYRLRATMAGKFRVGPATIQSMYAPEFAAFSSGAQLNIK